jgi:serine/threonine-protein kinase
MGTDRADARRLLLFGVIAYRLNLLDRHALVAGLASGVSVAGLPSDEVWRQSGVLDDEAARRVEAATRDLLALHGNDPARALAELILDAPTRAALDRIDDPGLRQAVAELGDAEADSVDIHATLAPLGEEPAPGLARIDPDRTIGLSELSQAMPQGPSPASSAGEASEDTVQHLGRQEPSFDPGLTVAHAPSGTRGVQAVEPDSTVAHDPGMEDPDATRPIGSNVRVDGGPTTVAATRADTDPTGRFEDSSTQMSKGQARPEPGHAPPSRPRYQVVRAHARGGLGEVFVALDGELGREVALKEIQGRYADDPVSRARFVVEAEVTGGLEHPGIVPVYGLGQYRDGRPYYAMRFIRGESLKEAIARFHPPRPGADDSTSPEATPASPEAQTRADSSSRELELHKLLRRFIDVCNAMGYAHVRGVIHRDLKPANIMLGPFGETLVVDWGLAKPLDRDTDEPVGASERRRAAAPSGTAEPGTGRLRPMSASGSMYEVLFGSTVGTPHYMSPEQANSREELTPASDIYSLGATLYCILAGRSPFTERDLKPLLDKVRRGDFLPPRQVNPAVPPALDAVCRKAMAVRPADRYATAGELAEDVEHWMADEPVSAYPEPWTARAARWARRHRTLVTTAAALLIMAVVGSSTAAVLINQERNRAEANFQIARDAVDTMLSKLGAVDLVDIPGAEAVRKAMLERARDFYVAFLAGPQGRRPSVKQGAGRAYVRLAEVDDLLGDYKAADDNFRRAIDGLKPMAEGQGSEADDYRRDLARAHHGYGVLLTRLSRYKDAEAELNAAMALRHELAAAKNARPSDRDDEHDSIYRLGTLAARQPGQRDKAESSYRKAIAQAEAEVDRQSKQPVATPAAIRDLARYRNNYAMLLRWSDPSRAETIFNQSREAQEKLQAAAPTVAADGWALARTLSNIGSLDFDLSGSPGLKTEQRTKRLNAALTSYKDAAKRLRTLAQDYPGVPDYRFELALILTNRAWVYEDAGMVTNAQADQIEADLNEALGYLDGLTREYPGRPDYQLRAADARVRLGILHRLRAQNDQAEAKPLTDPKDQVRRKELEARAATHDRDAQRIFKTALDAVRAIPKTFAEYANAINYHLTLADAIRWLGWVLFGQHADNPGDTLGKFEPDLTEAIGHCNAVMRDDPSNRFATRIAADARAVLFESQLGRGAYADAAATMADSARALREAPDPSPDRLEKAARLLARCLSRAGDEKLTAKYAPEVLAILKEAVRLGFDKPAEFDDPDYKAIKDRKEFQALKTAVKNARPRVG